MPDRVPMTVEGFQQLKVHLKFLKREQILNANEIEVAAAQGDRSENAEYHAAKEKQGHIAGNIARTEDMLARAQVIDPSKLSGDRVVFGATVQLYDADRDKEVEYTIVGEHEADTDKARISITSPLARAMIGKEEGDDFVARTPGGPRNYEIVSVRFAE